MAYIKPGLVGNHRKDPNMVGKVLSAKRKSISLPPLPTISKVKGRFARPEAGRFNLGGDVMPIPSPIEQMQPDDSWFAEKQAAIRPPANFFGGSPDSQPNLPPGNMLGNPTIQQINPAIMKLIMDMMKQRGGQAQRPPWEGIMRPGGVQGAPPTGSFY